MSSSSYGGWSDADTDRDPDAPTDPLAGLPEADRYERIDLIGVGGMGRVYEARDRVLGRTVALKEVAPHLSGTAAAERLAAEARLTAELDHPGIVSVHDAGRTADGRLFYTMRLVRGRTLDVEAAEGDRGRLLRHVLGACHAVGAAHARGVVHRDLKPANILVGPFGETQVVDWGLARRVGETGRGGGTEGFSSPEDAVDPRADVFSLGRTLLAVLEDDAPPELRAIVTRATAEAPADRYPDAEALALDLQRYLDGRRVRAYQYSRAELLRRTIRAWRAPLAVAAAATLLLAVALTVAWVRTTQARDRAVAAEQETRAALDASRATLAQALEDQSVAALLAGEVHEAEQLARRSLALADRPAARGVLMAVEASPRATLAAHEPLPSCRAVFPGPDGLLCADDAGMRLVSRDVERPAAGGPVVQAALAASFVAAVRDDNSLELWSRHGELLGVDPNLPGRTQPRFSPDGSWLGVGNDATLALFTLPTFARTDRAPCPDGAPITSIELEDDAAWVTCRGFGLAVIRGLPDGDVTLVPVSDPTVEPRQLHPSTGPLLASTAQGRLLALDRTSGALQGVVEAFPGPIHHAVWLGGDRVAVSGAHGSARVWDLAREEELLRVPGPVRALLVQGGSLEVLGEARDRWTLPDTVARRELVQIAGIAALAVSRTHLAAASGDGSVAVWRRDGTLERRLRWQERVAKDVAFADDGATLVATALGDPAVRRFRAPDWSDLDRFGNTPYRRAGQLADGTVLAVGYGRHVQLFRAEGQVPVILDAQVFDLATDPAGGVAVFLDEGGGVLRVRSGGAEPERLGPYAGSRGVAVDASGALVLLGSDRCSRVTDEGETSWTLPTGAIDVAVSADGRWIATGHLDGRARVWEDGVLRAELVGHRQRVGAVEFSPDGDELATADWEGRVLRWSMAPLRSGGVGSAP